MFHNLYPFCKPFRDHNWNDFFDDLQQDKEDYIEQQLRDGYGGDGPEPCFYYIFPLTLSPPACDSFLRSTNLPIVARDYYLSKLYQFLYVPLRIQFHLDHRDSVPDKLKEFLDGIPAGYLERLAEFDWGGFYQDSFDYDLEEVLRRLPSHLPLRKAKSVSKGMTKAQWVRENWPRALKRARGSEPQKVAAERCGVSEETYRKWEAGMRPPSPRCLDAVRKFIITSNPEGLPEGDISR